MRIATLDVRDHNTVFVHDDRYFVLEHDGRLFLVQDKCPHRGGPLSLASRSPDEKPLRIARGVPSSSSSSSEVVFADAVCEKRNAKRSVVGK